MLPAERFRLVIAPRVGSARELAEQTGLNVRSVESLLRGDTQRVRLGTADRLLTALGLTYLWHVPPPEGLADLYWGERA
jgi:hypothetical protein